MPVPSHDPADQHGPLSALRRRTDRQAADRGLVRLVQSLFREGLLDLSHLVMEGASAWLPLWPIQTLLHVEGLHVGRAGNCRLSGAITPYHAGERGQPLTTASALLQCIAPAMAVRPDGQVLQRLLADLDNSLDNDMYCLDYRLRWAAVLNQQLSASAGGFLAALREAPIDDPVLLLEQWGTLGHPWHPAYKTRPGLSPADMMALSPEFQARLHVQLAAVRRDCMHIETATPGVDYRAWFANACPLGWQRWEQALSARGETSAEWLPLPVHPYQAQRHLPEAFSAEIASGQLLLLPDVTLPAAPTMSVRTVVPAGKDAMPHIKLPVALQMTTAQRIVSPRAAVMGPRLTAMLRTLLAQDPLLADRLDILDEQISLHYRDPAGNDRHASHLSALYRANPLSRRTPALLPIPVATLFADSPRDGRPVVTELVRQGDGDHIDGALAFFRRYADVVLSATLGAYLRYGIAFEAHQQNSFIMVNQNLQPLRLLLRDFGDLRIHAPSLRQSGLTLDTFRSGRTLHDQAEPVREVLIHATLLCHLGELAHLLATSYHSPEAPFWDSYREQVAAVFDAYKHQTSPERWASERNALLQADWPAKSLMRMWFLGSPDDIHCTLPNPLRGART